MKKIVCLLVMLLLSLTACASGLTITETVLVTKTVTQTPTITIGQVLEIAVEPAPGSYLTGKIAIASATVTVGTYNQNIPVGAFITYIAGDPCLVLNGTMVNEDDVAWQVGFSAEGYSPKGSFPVSYSMDGFSGGGRLHAITIPAGGSRDFAIHLNWNDYVNLIKITGSLNSTDFPLP